MKIEKLIGKVGHARGVTSESSVKRVMCEGCEDGSLPDWILGYERANPKDDRAGIDGWVDTDVGKIKLQIKSSKRSARKFRKNNPETAVVVVAQGDEPEKIISKVISAVATLRNQYLEKRNDY